MNEVTYPKMEGWVEIFDDNGNLLMKKKNAIHYENMSYCMAMVMSHQGYGHIDKLYFGNGASTVTGTGAISYFPPNTVGSESALYNATYKDKIVDGTSQLNLDPTRNYLQISHTDNQPYTDIIVHCHLDYNEPDGQEAFDDARDNEGFYVFDEMGLMSYPENGIGEGKLLTHCIFHPIQKSLSRSLTIKYYVRIYIAE